MKKLISVILTLAVLASAMIFAIPVSAEEVPEAAPVLVDATYGEWGGASNLFDRQTVANHGSKWCLAFNGSAFVTWKYSKAINIVGYVLSTGNDTNQCPERNPEDWVLYGSNDEGVTWTVIDTVVADEKLPAATCEDVYYELDTVAPAYSYYKMEFTKIGGGSCMQLSELELIRNDQAIYVDATRGEWGGARNLFDGISTGTHTGNNIYAKWCVAFNGSVSATWRYLQPRSIDSYTITTGHDSKDYGTDRSPKSWTLYGSNDAGETWSVVDSRVDDNTIQAENYADYTFTLDAPSAMYSYFKIEITKIGAGGCLQIAELALNETEKTIDFSGVQVSDSVSDTFAVRFLSTVDELSYNVVGYRMNITYKGATKTGVEKETSEVYTSVVAGTHNGIAKEVLASELGGAYIQALTIYNIDATAGDVVFEITPYTVKDGVTSDGYSYAITVNNGVVVSCARLVK